MISVAQSGVKVFKMKWAGMFPAATLWTSESIADVAEKFFNEQKPIHRPLDAVIERLVDCRSAAEVVVRLAAKTVYEADDVLQQYAAILQRGGHQVIRDASELPYSKEVIKSVLRRAMEVSKKEDKQTLEALKVAYVSLANFQPLAEEERDAVSVMGTLSGSSSDEAIEQLHMVGEIYLAVLAKWSAESDGLSKELKLVGAEDRDPTLFTEVPTSEII
jgi:hypothetical protein